MSNGHVACVLAGCLMVSMACSGSVASDTVYVGSFYANDSGVSHGGFEWTCRYDAKLVYNGRSGTLTLTSQACFGDSLMVHGFSVTDVQATSDELQFAINASRAHLIWTATDTIWGGMYNNYFVANSTANPAEAVGSLSIQPFSGFRSWYYVELRLRPQ